MSSSPSQTRSFGLENLIKEAVTLALYEQDQAPPMAPPPAPNAGPVPPAPPVDPAQAQPPQPPPGAPDAAQQPPMTIDSMIERLNVIRGGKSFTDPEVYGQIVTYFKKITPEQNQIIDQYLADISKIMVNVRTGVDGSGADQMGTQQPGTPPAPGGAPQAPISPGAGAVSPAGGAAGATTSPGGV